MDLFANEPTTVDRPHGAPLRARMFQGAILVAFLTLLRLPTALGESIPIGFFLLAVAVVAVGGAVGGAVYYATDRLRARGTWRRTFANVFSLLAYAGFTLGAFALAVLLVP